MTLTRADAESVLVKRTRGKMEAVSMTVTVVGSNADLDDPLVSAFRAMGYTPTSAITVSDADLSSIPDGSVPEYLDRATLALLKNIHTNTALVDIKSGPQDEKLSQLATQLEKAIGILQNEIAEKYDAADSMNVTFTRRIYRDAYRTTEEESAE